MKGQHTYRGRRALFLVLAVGELLRLVLLGLLGAARFAALGEAPLAIGAWLNLFLAPHAVVATALLFMAGRPSGSVPGMRTVALAKLLGAPAAAVVVGTKLPQGLADTVSVSLPALHLPPLVMPEWLLLGAIALWDLGILGLMLLLWLPSGALAGAPASPHRGHSSAAAAAKIPAPPGPTGNPVYRDADIETVAEDRERETDR